MKEIFIWDGQCDKKDIDITLNKENFDHDLKIVLPPQEGKDLTLNLNITHKVPSSTSKVDIRAVIANNSAITVNVMIAIEPGMKSTQTDLTGKGILLADNSRIKITPSMRVRENSAKANHGVTISHINQEELFYLKTRGLSDEQAREQIIKGFLNV